MTYIKGIEKCVCIFLCAYFLSAFQAARSAAILFGQESSLHRFDLDSVLAKLSILTSSWELEQDLRLAIYFAIYGEYWNTAKVL